MLESLKILLADDEEIVYQTISGYLLDLGHQVDKACNALKALKAVQEKEYDMTIIDIRMPGMNGICLLSKIIETRPEMLIVIITGHNNIDIAVQALKLGAMDFLTKPIKLTEIDAVLEKANKLRMYRLQHLYDMEELQKAYENLQTESEKRKEIEKALQEAEKRYLSIMEELKSKGGIEIGGN